MCDDNVIQWDKVNMQGESEGDVFWDNSARKQEVGLLRDWKNKVLGKGG